MPELLSSDSVKIRYSSDGTIYQDLPNSTTYSFGLNCKSKEYQPAGSDYTLDAKLSKKVDLKLDLAEVIGFDLPDPCYIMIAISFADNLIWVKQGKFQRMNESLAQAADAINTRSIQFSVIGNIDSYITTALTQQIELVWETITYSPNPTYELVWETITYSPNPTYELVWETIAI